MYFSRSADFFRPANCALILCVAAAWVPFPGRAAAQGIQAADLLKPQWSGGLVDNSAFVPAAEAAKAHSAFRGTLSLSETEMTIKPRAFASRRVLGRDTALFPGVALSFFTVRGDLVPFTQDVIRAGSIGSGRSFWDIIVQPGRVWSEPGDGDWSRAAFPFALVNSLEGETHNGIATFLYTAGTVSNLRFQIVQQTAPYLVKEYFFAAGLVPARFLAEAAGIEAMTRTYEASLKDAVRMAPWSELEAKAGALPRAGFDGRIPARDVILGGIDYQGTFYLEECRSAAGPLPWCDRARFGVWSATKALANETALLRLAEKYGPAVFDLQIKDYVPQAAGRPGWEHVRFEDAIDMATGIGNGSARIDPNDINDGYLEGGYDRWYEARSVEEKVRVLLDSGGVHPWGPGKVARYRDQDMFLLGVAMNNFLKSKEGDAADLWSMLEKEVFEPIGIHYAPTNRTLEPGGGRGQPLMAGGFYPTIGDMVRIARLYHAGGRHGAKQILYAPRVAALLPGREPRGLPTGETPASGAVTYINAFWVTPYRAAAGCRLYYPRMLGWGGNIIALLPHGVTGIRVAKTDEASGNAESDTAGMARVAELLVKFCD